MTEPQFEEFLSKSIKNFGDEYIELDEDLYEPHEFSPEFERKMEKLFRPKKHNIFPLLRSRTRRIALALSCVAVVSSVAVMSVGVARGKFFCFNMKKAPTHTVVSFEKDGTSTEGFDKVYEITELPEGFELTSKENHAYYYLTEYRNKNQLIILEQWDKKYYRTYDNTENEKSEIISIGNTDGYLVYTSDSDYMITWENGNFILSLISNIEINNIYSVLDSIN